MGEFKQATVTLRGAMTFDGTGSTDTTQTVRFDAGTDVGGHDEGLRPVEMLLMGLAGCTAMDVISILRKKKQQVTALSVEVSGTQRDEHPRIFEEIAIVYHVAGHDVDEKAVARAIELSETRYCPASAMLREATTITSRYEISAAAAEAEPV